MKKKFLIALLAMVVSVCCCFGIAACDDDENGWADGIFTVETAYAEAQELGYTGTLEEFIASISGTNGVGISAVTLNDDGELVVTLSDSSSLNLGVIKGADGKDGENGEDGEDGKDGATWYNGTCEAMNSVTANVGDYYLTTDTYAVYTYTADGWTLVIESIKGETGAQGETGSAGAAGETGAAGTDGATWYTGEGAPSTETGTNGDLYLDTASYDIYKMSDGAWTKIGNIKGATGETGETGAQGETGSAGATGETGAAGTDGATWYTGEGAPSTETGTNGDLYLDTASYDIYKMTDGEWVKIGNIKGADGVDGEDGEDLTAATVTITFDANGGEVEYETLTVTKGDSVDLPVPTRDGYVFTGWYYGTGANAGQVTDVTPISRDMTLVAQWEKIYEMTVVAENDNVYVESDSWFYGYYEGGFTTNLTDITITVDGDEYTIDEAISAGYVEEYEVESYNAVYTVNTGTEEYKYNFECWIYFAQEGEYTVTFNYGYSSASYTVEVVNYYLYVEEDEIVSGDYVYFSSRYNGDYVSAEPTITITDGEDYSATISLYENSDYRDGTISLCNFYSDLWYYGSNNYEGYINGHIYFYEAGEYTVTITYGKDYYSFDVTVTNVAYNIAGTDIYTYEESYAWLGYYGDSDYFTVNIVSDYGYDYTYTFTGMGTHNVYDNEDSSNSTTYIYEGWYSGSDVWAYIYFNVGGTYTVTIDFGDGSVSYTVTVTDYVFEGEVEVEEIWWDGCGTIENNAEISESTIDLCMLEIDLSAPEDYSVSITVNDTEISSPEDYIYTEWRTGELGIVFYPADFVNYEAGTYTITITVSSKDNGSATITLTYVLDEISAYVEYIYSSGSVSHGYDIDCTEVAESLSVRQDRDLKVDIYAINAEVSVTLDGNELTAATVKYYYNDYGDIEDVEIETEGDYYVVYYRGWNEIVISNSLLTAGEESTMVITAVGTNGTATATLNLTALIWYSYIETEITVNCDYSFDVIYYGDQEATPAVTISYGDTTYSVTWEEEDCCASATITDSDDNEILYYDISYADGCVSFLICAYVEGSYTITVTYGEDSAEYSFDVICFLLYVDNTEMYVGDSISFELYYYGSYTNYIAMEVVSDESYYQLCSSEDYSLYYSDSTTTFSLYYDGVEWANGNICFKEAGTYVVAIGFYNEDDEVDYTSFYVYVYSNQEEYDPDTDVAAYVGNSYTVDFTNLIYYENDVESEELKETMAEQYASVMIITITFTDSETATFVMDSSFIEGGSIYSLTGSYTLDNGTFIFTDCEWDDGSTSSDTSGSASVMGDATEFINGSMVSLGYDGTDVTFWIAIGGSGNTDEDGNVIVEQVYTAAGAMVLVTE